MYSQKKTRNAIDYIVKYYHSNIKIETLALQCNCSIAVFSEVFKIENSVSTQEFIKEYRIYKAQLLLKDLDLRVQQIAYDVGFENTSLFNQMFKSIVGVTPSQYRLNI